MLCWARRMTVMRIKEDKDKEKKKGKWRSDS